LSGKQLHKVVFHFIQHCLTNGDPRLDIKRVKAPTGIPKSMLMAIPDGSYALSRGVVVVLKSKDAAFLGKKNYKKKIVRVTTQL
jgi:E3 ubiquitin-protein ligase RBBP6